MKNLLILFLCLSSQTLWAQTNGNLEFSYHLTPARVAVFTPKSPFEYKIKYKQPYNYIGTIGYALQTPKYMADIGLKVYTINKNEKATGGSVSIYKSLYNPTKISLSVGLSANYDFYSFQSHAGDTFSNQAISVLASCKAYYPLTSKIQIFGTLGGGVGFNKYHYASYQNWMWEPVKEVNKSFKKDAYSTFDISLGLSCRLTGGKLVRQ